MTISLSEQQENLQNHVPPLQIVIKQCHFVLIIFVGLLSAYHSIIVMALINQLVRVECVQNV